MLSLESKNTKMPAFNKSTKAEKVTLTILLVIFAIGTTVLFINDGKLFRSKTVSETEQLSEPIRVTTD